MKAMRGFTLVEVLVALAITAIALFAGTQATSALTRSSQRQADLLLAQLCAENTLINQRLMRQMPGVGEFNSECEQGSRKFQVQMKVNPTPNPSFMRVQVSVREAELDYGILQIATIVGRF
jgi:general secretion pathway protein I